MTKTNSKRGNPNWKPGVSGNPNGRPTAREDSKSPGDVTNLTESMRYDGWQSMITGMGTAMFDKRLSADFVCEPVSWAEAREIYRGDPLGARSVDLWPQHMLREGYEICVSDNGMGVGNDNEDPDPGTILTQDSRQAKRTRVRAIVKAKLRQDAAEAKTADQIKKVLAKAKALKLNTKLKEAIAYSRAYGGGAIMVGANDGQKDWSKPIDYKKVVSIDWLTSLEPRELTPWAVYSNPKAAKYGEVAIWQLTTNTPGRPVETEPVAHTMLVHESRLIIFQDVKVTREVSMQPGWGDSVYTRSKSVLRDYNIGWSSAGILVHDFSIAIMKIKGLSEMVGTDNQKKLLARMAAVALGQSVARLTLIDKDEEFGRQTTALTGLPDLLEKFCQQLAAAFDVPVTLLMGMSPSGLNATGESDIRGFYDRIAAAQIEILEPALREIFKLIFLSLGMKEPPEWTIEFRPLWQQSDKEIADTRFTNSQTDEKNIANGLYSAEEARRSRYGGAKYSQEITIDEPENDNYDPADAAELDPTAVDPTVPTDPMQPKVGIGQPDLGTATPAKPQETAFAAGQITSAMEIIKAVIAKEIPRESGIAMLQTFFPFDSAKAVALMGPEDFEAPKPPPMAPGFGGGLPGAPKPGVPKPGAPDMSDNKNPKEPPVVAEKAPAIPAKPEDKKAV